VTSNFAPKYRYVGAALTADVAWLVGAAFAPLVALGLSAHFGLAYVSVYLLSGAVATLAALGLNRALARD
jgi:MFS family permease